VAAAAGVLERPRPRDRPLDAHAGGGAVSAQLVHDAAPARPLVRRPALRPHHVGLAAILALAACLDFWSLTQNGYANTYYAGAVRSMLKSWHNFFFVSFDPGGLVSVDKPPLALWLQALSAKVLGFSSFSILLPEALAGVGAVWLLYLLVARYFGRVSGLVAALALAVSPVSVSVNRDNNPDALLAVLLIASVYLGARAVESGRLRWLVGSAVLVGLAFNTKMLAAMVVVPGIALAYLLLARPRRRVRFLHLAVAAVVLVAVSGAWIAAVDLTPAADRPYVGSTTDNSALSLAFDYNGIGRVTGQTGGTSTGGGMGGAFSGSPGVLRLINDALGDQGGWLLPLAIVGALSALVHALRRRRRRELVLLTVAGGWFAAAAFVFSYSSGIIHTYYLSALAPATCALVGVGLVALWRDARRGGLWLALPLAAIGLTAWLEVSLLRRTGYLPWLQPLVIAGALAAAGLLLTLAFPSLGSKRLRLALSATAIGLAGAAFLVAPAAWSETTLEAPVNGVFPGGGPDFVSGLGTASTGRFVFGGGPGLGGLPGGGRRPGAGGGFTPPGTGSGFAPPTGSVAPPARGGFAPPTGQGGFSPPPGAGSGTGRFAAPGGAGSGGAGGASDIAAALTYVEAHGATDRFTLVVSSEQEAASYVVKGENVAAMGGFTGRETVLTNAYLARLVRSGQARYFLLGGSGGFGPGGGSNAAASTIESACTQVSSSVWNPASSSSGGRTLYDCGGRADAIGNAR
jgi:4-amino-4-deoxy-L-arabinose transferase-like glycosyltransferase